ncbi:Na+/H+ antiporter NhaA [Sphingomonas sp. CFBP 13714]|uniref:Na+/H+ antiporter NhaA n=1 Tax=Sphingomonas sp. CFBP 13714 TaxID=2775308 RepID=UPI001786D31F|nr:Na+/H+ antiporter NhaA [Sphingomonas sp. CFBP 13714]MBD8702035.1 Na+/H+ antiporter NhaA [Sphingomonas sp. CFBP 13714]
MAAHHQTGAKARFAFLRSEAAGGLLLMGAAALAMIAANLPGTHSYHDVLHMVVGPTLSDQLGPMTPHLWINDGLMALFFLLVGLELKREFLEGRLSRWSDRTMPAVAAAAGMAIPALIYLLVAGSDPLLHDGWAIPAATDIAFALGVLALLRNRVPASLKLLLMSVAIVDDLGAVAIIALFYTASIDALAITAAATIFGIMHLLRWRGVNALTPYLILGGLLWYAVLLSGVHATIAGVLAATAIPLRARGDGDAPLHRLEHALTPLVGLLIVPLFGFANAGVSLTGIGLQAIIAPLPLGVAAGLFLGKQIGIFGALQIGRRLRLFGALPGASMMQTYGVVLLCGIGFTMSLFIGALAFPTSPHLAEEAKIGILLGSMMSALAGYGVLRFSRPKAFPASTI